MQIIIHCTKITRDFGFRRSPINRLLDSEEVTEIVCWAHLNIDSLPRESSISQLFIWSKGDQRDIRAWHVH